MPQNNSLNRNFIYASEEKKGMKIKNKKSREIKVCV